jgi:diketogulonate reductase-like aldo/keto reductase
MNEIHIPTVELANGVLMPSIVLGTAHLMDSPNGKMQFEPELTFRQAELALKAGLRSFDCAHIYRSQNPLGQVLGHWLRVGGIEKRSDVWITSKVFHPYASAALGISHMPTLPSMTPQEVQKHTKEFFEKSLLELNIGYVDLMLLHWPGEMKKGTVETNRKLRLAAWTVLEECYHRGWCRAIGVANFSVGHLQQLEEDGAKIRPHVNQIEASIEVQYTDIREYCKSKNIVLQAHSAIRGISKHASKFIKDLGQKYGKDDGQIAMRYLIQHGYTIAVLTKKYDRMISNTKLFDFELNQEEMNILDSFNKDDGGWGLPKPHEIP